MKKGRWEEKHLRTADHGRVKDDLDEDEEKELSCTSTEEKDDDGEEDVEPCLRSLSLTRSEGTA